MIQRRVLFQTPGYFLTIFRWILLGSGALLLVLVAYTVARFGWHAYNRRWHGNEPYRVLLLQQDGELYTGAAIFNYFPEFRRAVIILLPPELKVRAVGGLGEYQLQSYFRLQRQEQLPEAFVRESVAHTFGMPVHKIIPMQVSFSQKQELIKRLSWELWWEFFNTESNLVDNFRLLQEIRSFSPTDLTVADAVSLRLTVKQSEADGLETRMVEPNNLAHYLKKSATPVVPEFADLEVFVENTTRYSALGSHWSRFVETGGFHLVGVGDNTVFRQKSTIRFATEQLAINDAGKALRRLFPLFSFEVGEIEGGRSEVVLYLGEDAGQFLHEREFLRSIW